MYEEVLSGLTNNAPCVCIALSLILPSMRTHTAGQPSRGFTSSRAKLDVKISVYFRSESSGGIV